MIKLKQLQKVYHRGKPNEIIALKPLDLQVCKGEFVIIIGSNGSGKSTLINTIAGSIAATSGEVYIDDKNVTRLESYQRSRWIARVFQNPLLGTATELSILDNFRLAALRSSPKLLKAGIDESFRQRVKAQISILNMGLENKIDQPMGLLSGGQRQALTLLMAVMDDLKILLLDEPTAALDPRSAEIVMHTANELIKSRQLTAILITHNLKDAYHYGNRLILMEEGGVKIDFNRQQKAEISQSDLYSLFI
jgi:putative ABC transport system ATP-binding protein